MCKVIFCYDQTKENELTLEEWKDLLRYMPGYFVNFLETKGDDIVGAYFLMSDSLLKRYLKAGYYIDQEVEDIKFLSGKSTLDRIWGV